MISGALDHVRRRNLFVVVSFGRNKPSLRIDVHAALAVVGTGLHLKQLASAFKVHFVTVDHSFQRVGRGVSLIASEDRPDRWVFRTEPPQGETSGMITAGGAHLVERR